MSKKYLIPLLSLALALGVTTVALAEETTVNTTATTNTTNTTVRMGVRADLKATYDAQRKALEAQRKQMMQNAEAMRAKAQAAGDEMKAKHEAMKLEMEAKRAEMDAKREAMKKEMEMKKASSTARRIEFQQDVAKRKVENVAKTTTMAIERLEKIIARIESRIAKLKAKNIDTAEAERLVNAAKTNLSDARAAVEAFANLDLTSEKAKDNFEKVRTAAADARELIRLARENLILAIRSLSAHDDEVEATTTAETN